MTTTALFIIFFPLSLVILANAVLVRSHNRTMRISIALLGLSLLGLSMYWAARSIGLVEGDLQSIETSRLILVGAAVGMYSIFGTPLFLELTKKGDRHD